MEPLALQRAFDSLIKTSAYNINEVDEGGGNQEAGSNPISNTRWFLLEDNVNFSVAENDLTDLDLDVDAVDDPSKPVEKGCNLDYVRWYVLRNIIQSLTFRLVTILLILVDLGLIIADLVINCPGNKTSRTLSHIDLAISCYFVLEILLRMFALKPGIFFQRKLWFNILDFIIVVLTFSISVAYAVIVSVALKDGLFDEDECKANGEDKNPDVLIVIRVLVILRVVRFVRLARLIRIYTEQYQLKKAIRQKVSQNKRRFQADGIDLDLTYVTKRVIAMSFPSTGWRSWYRNPIAEVSAFFKNHHEHKYRLFNLCSERSYDDSWFDGRVSHVPIDDHNVPSVEQMVDFIDEVDDFLAEDPENVIAVHCKGGKGRTGTMICVLLVHQGIFADAATSLEYFGQRRTDHIVDTKFQGVETASQIRYVAYFEELKKKAGQKYPSKVPMTLVDITIYGIRNVGKGDGSDLYLAVSDREGRNIFRANLESVDRDQIYKRDVDIKANSVTIHLLTHPEVKGDVRIKFFCSSASVPKGYEKCAFYYWFNTAFVHGNNNDEFRSISMNREEIDNPHKPKTWKIFQEDFKIVTRLKTV